MPIGIHFSSLARRPFFYSQLFVFEFWSVLRAAACKHFQQSFTEWSTKIICFSLEKNGPDWVPSLRAIWRQHRKSARQTPMNENHPINGMKAAFQAPQGRSQKHPDSAHPKLTAGSCQSLRQKGIYWRTYCVFCCYCVSSASLHFQLWQRLKPKMVVVIGIFCDL